MTDMALLFSLDSPFRKSFPVGGVEEFGTYLHALVQVQKVRNMCTHGPLMDLEALPPFTNQWDVAVGKTLDWKTQNCSRVLSISVVDAAA